jgi:hypothetical protein
MDISQVFQRWFVLITIALCIVLALLFAAFQTGII